MPFFILSDEPVKPVERRVPKLIPMNEFEKEPVKASGKVHAEPMKTKKKTKAEKELKARDESEARVVALADTKPTKKQVHEFFKSRIEELTT